MAGTVCASPPPEMGLVEGLLGSVECNVLNMAEAGYGAIARPGSSFSVALTIMLTLYIGLLGFRLMIGRAPLRIDDLTMTVLKIGAVLALATSWPTYQQLVFDTLFRGPEQLGAGMLDAVQSPQAMLGGNPLEALQRAYDEMQATANFLSQRSLGQISPFQGGNGFGAFAMNLSSLCLLMTTVGIILAAKIVLGLLLALGPVFVAFLLFDATRGLFEGWLRASLAFALAPMMAILCLVGQLMLLEPHLIRLAEARELGVVDLAPTSAVLLLSLIFAGVAIALSLAVGVIATGFRLPGRAPQLGTPTREERTREANASPAQAAGRDRLQESGLRQPERAVAIAAAAAALERREHRISDPAEATPRRQIRMRAGEGPANAQRQAPLGQTYRRSAQPRRTVSSVRRDG